MRTNVGGNERIVRLLAGTLLLLAGWRWLEGRRTRRAALATGGELLVTGVTCWCPANAAVGRDTAGRRQDEAEPREDVPA